MTSLIEDPTISVPPGFTPLEPDCISQATDVFDFIYTDEYDNGYDNSVNSEPVRQHKNNRGIHRVFFSSKQGQIHIRRDVPPKLRETVGRKYVMIPVYETSATPNHRIKNAITGISTPHRVGTQAEDLYFKVCWATGTEGRREPINLFFETPREFEKYFMETLTDDVKTNWLKRYRIIEKAYLVAKEKAEITTQTFTFIH